MPSPEQLLTLARITSKTAELGYTADVVPNISEGPILSVYRLLPTGSTRVAQLEALASDFAVTLGVEDVLVKRLPGEAAVAVFVPRVTRSPVKWLDLLSRVGPLQEPLSVPLILGVDHLGNPVVDDLTKMPHLLVSGATGSGKSTCLSAMLASLVYFRSPTQVKLVLSDTKQVEFNSFTNAPHLALPIAKSVYQTMESMEWLIDEVEYRLKAISKAGLRNIHEFNSSAVVGKPMVVLVIDELADLLLDRSKSKESGTRTSIGKQAGEMLGKIVQKSRAAGVYVIASVQRPSVNIVEGSIKANFPARLSFRQASFADSMTVLGTAGAEHLLSQGDCLYINPSKQGITRVHSPYASIQDMQAAVEMAVYRASQLQLGG